MRGTVERKALDRAIATLPSTAKTPILNNVRLQFAGDRLTVSWTDLEAGCLSWFPAEVQEPGSRLANVRQLKAILKHTGNGHVEIADGTVGNFALESSDDVEDFPEVHEMPLDGTFGEIPSFALRRMIDQSIFAVAKEDPRYAITGVRWEFFYGDRLKLVGTDGRQLAVSGMADCDTYHRCGTGVICPTGLKLLRKLLSDGPEVVSFSLRPNEVFFQMPGHSLVARYVEGRFPDYDAVIPKDGDCKAKAVASYSVLAAAVWIANTQDADEDERTVVFSGSDGRLQIKGKHQCFVVGDVTHGTLEDTAVGIRFLRGYLTAVASHHGSDPTVPIEISFHGKDRPIVFDLQRFRYVVMPWS